MLGFWVGPSSNELNLDLPLSAASSIEKAALLSIGGIFIVNRPTFVLALLAAF